MRIAHFIDTVTHGGAETIALDLCAALKEYGHEPVVFHFDSPYLRDQCHQLGLSQAIVPRHDLYKSIRTTVLFARLFRKFIKEQRIEVLHSHLFGPIVAAGLGAAWSGIPHVGTLHDVHIVAERPNRIRLLQLVAALGTRLVAVSGDMLRFYRTNAYFPAISLRLIYNGVRVRDDGARLATRVALGLGPTDRVVVCVGRLVELKRHHDVLTALALVREQLPAELLIAGIGPLEHELRAKATELGIASRVRFLGSRDDVPALLAASDVFVLASRTEGLSRSILEAMAAGLPVVTTRVGGNAELVVEGETGYLVDPGDPANLASRLGALLASPDLQMSFGRAARRRVQESFSIESMVRDYFALYGGEFQPSLGNA